MMHALYRYLKTTILGGILVLLPLVGCVYLIGMTLKAVLDNDPSQEAVDRFLVQKLRRKQKPAGKTNGKKNGV